jgi:hypothetical protein
MISLPTHNITTGKADFNSREIRFDKNSDRLVRQIILKNRGRYRKAFALSSNDGLASALGMGFLPDNILLVTD